MKPPNFFKNKIKIIDAIELAEGQFIHSTNRDLSDCGLIERINKGEKKTSVLLTTGRRYFFDNNMQVKVCITDISKQRR